MSRFQFVHAADIHLDSPLTGLAGHDGPAIQSIRTATREALVGLVTRTIDERAAFLLVAGDIYDGTWRDYQTGLFFIRQMGRLREAEIPVYLIYGNHDAASQLTRHLALPDNVVKLPTSKPGTRLIHNLGVAIHGQSFRRSRITDNIALRYPDPHEGYINIGMLHTSLTGAEGHENYAPCSLEQLIAKGYDYWALGHVHHHTVRHENPHVVYPGVLQGRHIRETGPKGAVLVSVDDGVAITVKPFHVDVVRWREVSVSAADCRSIQDLEDALHLRIEEEVSREDRSRIVACRIRLTGRTRAHQAAIASQERLLAVARAAAEGVGEERAWIERLVVATEPQSHTTLNDRLADTFGDVADARNDPDLIERLRSEVGTFTSRLDVEVRTLSEDQLLKAAAAGDFGRLIELASPLALAKLVHEGTN